MSLLTQYERKQSTVQQRIDKAANEAYQRGSRQGYVLGHEQGQTCMREKAAGCVSDWFHLPEEQKKERFSDRPLQEAVRVLSIGPANLP